MDEKVEKRSFSQSLSSLLDRVVCRAVHGSDFDAVCRLRYDAYRREDSLPEGTPRLFSDHYDSSPNTTSYGVFVDGALAGSLRVHVFDRDHPESPATTTFPDIILPMMEGGALLVDGTRFVVDVEAARRFPNIAYAVARIAWMAGHHYCADWIVTTCRPEHQAFYRRVFGHEVVTPPRSYPGLTKPQGLLKLDQRRRTQTVHARYPFFASTEAERQRLFGGHGARRSA